jgi:hypothetical protein
LVDGAIDVGDSDWDIGLAMAPLMVTSGEAIVASVSVRSYCCMRRAQWKVRLIDGRG